MKNELPSGRKIFNPFTEEKKEVVTEAIYNPAAVVQGTKEQVSTSAMSHDADDECPKCRRKMQPAKTPVAPVYFCDNCRVAHPMRA